MQGIVKWYDSVKGFGFIRVDDSKDIFVHRTGLENSLSGLEEGQSVEFETKDGDRGPVAIDVRVI